MFFKPTPSAELTTLYNQLKGIEIYARQYYLKEGHTGSGAIDGQQSTDNGQQSGGQQSGDNGQQSGGQQGGGTTPDPGTGGGGETPVNPDPGTGGGGGGADPNDPNNSED